MLNGMLIKVCGMTQAQNIREVEALGVDLIGHIFYPRSPRCMKEVPAYLEQTAGRVGVFVDATEEEILAQNELYAFQYVQLHGSESPELCSSLRGKGLRVIKAISVGREDRRLSVKGYHGCVDLFLFDTKCPGAGGSGISFDWTVLDSYDGSTPFLLSGGIGPESIDALHAFSHPMLAGYDLNSRFESAPGVKDAKMLDSFLKLI